MRTTTLASLMLVAISYTANAQKFSILPQAGLENPFTKISYNNLSSFLPLQAQITPHFGVRMDYKLKQLHGPYIGVSTSRSVVAFNFSNPETGMDAYQASRGKTKLQFEGGWQFSTKPIYFGKTPTSTKTAATPNKLNANKRSHGDYSARSHCGRSEAAKAYSSRGRCGGARESSKTSTAKKSQNNNWFVRIQPSAGMAFIPSSEPDVITKTQGMETLNTYNAGNIKTAFVTGAGFEFGSNAKRQFTLSVNYFKGLGDNESKIISQSGTKTTTTSLSSKVSGWTATLGIPLNLGKKPVVKQPSFQKMHMERKSGCEQYKIRCRKTI